MTLLNIWQEQYESMISGEGRTIISGLIRWGVIAAVLVSFIPIQLRGQQEKDSSREQPLPYKIEAGHLRGEQEEGERVIYLEGGVKIIRGEVTIMSQRGKHYPGRKYVVLTGDVNVYEGGMNLRGNQGEYYGEGRYLVMKGEVRGREKNWRMFCQKARYNREARVARFTGDVKLVDSTRVLYGDTIYYNRENETAEVFGNVVMVDQVEDYSIAGDHAFYNRSTGKATVDVRPVLTFDLSSEERGIVRSRWMDFDVSEEMGIAVDSVNMKKGNTSARCDSAVIFNDRGVVELYGEPVARSASSGMSGPRMIFWYNEREVERVSLPVGGRLTESPGPGSYWDEDSWIEGDSVMIYLSGEMVDSVNIVGSSRAMYYPVEGEERKVSNNYSNGDTMFFSFREGELEYVRISGAASGRYNFVNLSPVETIDSLAAATDTSLSYLDFGQQAEQVRYQADFIEYFAQSEELRLRGRSSLEYQNKELEARNIDFSSRLNILDATGNPVLREDEQDMFGVEMSYDMDSEGGLVMRGNTKFQNGYYSGENIFKDGKDILKVYNSVYTTCDLKAPHYSFRSNRMKVYIKDKIVSGPITMYLGEVPVFYLPFMVNSIKKERHSGILRPNFDIGFNSRQGRFIRGLGYYWATNDYTDFKITADFNERQNFRIHLDNRYKVRYLLDGSVRFDYFRDLNNYSNEWKLNSQHSQELGRNASFRSSLKFVSSDNAQQAINRSEDIRRFVDRRIYSRASFNKSWGGTRLGISASRNQKLNVSSPEENRISATMPSLSLNLPRTTLWFGEEGEEGEKGMTERIPSSIMISPNLSVKRQTEESDAREKATLSANSGTGFSRQFKLGFINLSPSLNMSWRYFKVLRDQYNPAYLDPAARAELSSETVVSPTSEDPLEIDSSSNRLVITLDGETSGDIFVETGSYTSGEDVAHAVELAVNTDASLQWGELGVEFVARDSLTGHYLFYSRSYGAESEIAFQPVAADAIYDLLGITPGVVEYGSDREDPARDSRYTNEVSMNLGSRMGTTIYGVFYPRIGPLQGIRHTINPTISYSYRPKLTRDQRSSQGISYSLRNVLDIKLKQENRETKKKLLTWNISGSYDPDAPARQGFSSISSSMNTSLGRFISLRMSNRYNPYQGEILSTNLSGSLDLSLGGSFSYPARWSTGEKEKIAAAGDGDVEEEKEEEEVEEREEDGEERYPDRAGRSRGNGKGKAQSWSLGLRYNMTRSKSGENIRMDSKLDIRAKLNLTRGWKLSYNAYYNVESREFREQTYRIERDLHCWTAGFVHRRFGDEWSYYFQISIKEHPEIMYERGKRGLQSTLPY